MSDLSDLDGNSLVARLGVVRERVVAQAYSAAERATPSDRERLEAELEDTEAVIDECGVRLLGRVPRHPYEPDDASHERMEDELRQAEASDADAQPEIERLRTLIRASVMHEMGAAPAAPTCPRSNGACWWCGVALEPADGAPDPHRPGCPWPALVVEAARP